MKKLKPLLFILFAPAFIITVLYRALQHSRVDNQKRIKELELKISKLKEENNKIKKQKNKSSKYTPENNSLRQLMQWEA